MIVLGYNIIKSHYSTTAWRRKHKNIVHNNKISVYVMYNVYAYMRLWPTHIHESVVWNVHQMAIIFIIFIFG